MKDVDFESLKEELIVSMRNWSEIVLSTSCKDRVTSRTVFFFSEGLDLYFITSSAYTKYKQIVKNPNVALCRDNIQIEGTAEIVGHPSVIEFNVVNADVRAYISQYSKYKNTVMIKVVPSKVTLYRGKGLYDYLDIRMNKATRKGHERSE